MNKIIVEPIPLFVKRNSAMKFFGVSADYLESQEERGAPIKKVKFPDGNITGWRTRDYISFIDTLKPCNPKSEKDRGQG
ncbi:MAG: hypothetical protein JXK94_11975 [Deltaproteobacteria bacterium]|nr:hypothetical protein [Deltaproteobacteria bacterium]